MGDSERGSGRRSSGRKVRRQYIMPAEGVNGWMCVSEEEWRWSRRLEL